MASGNSDIMVDVGSDITALKKGMKDGAKSVGDFSRKIAPKLREATNNIAKLGAAASVAAAGGLLAMTKSATAAGRELKIFSQISNTSIQEFQNLSSAAAEFGITNEKLADQLKDVKDRVGDFLATGGGPMADFFEKVAPKVGVTAEQFKNLSGAQSLQLYISSLEKANLSQAEMTFYLEAMASDLTQLAPLFSNNGQLIAENEKRLKDMGLALSDIDVMQLEEGAKAFARMKESTEAAANVIGAKLSPFVVAATEKLEEMSKEGSNFGNSVDEAIRRAIKAVGFFADAIHGLKVVFKGVEVIAKGFGATVVFVVEGAASQIAKFLDIVNIGINATIDALNKLPKVDIANIDPFSESPFMQGIHNLGDAARMNFATTREELAALAMVELPSENIDKFLNNVIEKSAKAAEVAKETHNKILNPEETEEDKAQAKYAEQLTEYQNFLTQKLGIQKSYNDSVSGLIQKQWGDAAAGTAGAMKSILGTMSTQSRKAFEISKAWALGDAIVSTAQGIAAGVKLGWPMGIPAVAWATATGLAQINQIKNQKFGGSGGAAAAGNGTPATAPNPIGVGGVTGGGSGGAQAGQTLTLAPIDPGALFSGANVQMLADRLAEFTADGGTIVTT